MNFSTESFTQAAEVMHQQGRGAQGAEKLFVTFNMEAELDEDESREKGRPIHRDVEYVRIIVPGDNKNVVHRKANPQDRQRFAAQYAAFKAGESEALVGTRLRDWPVITRAQVENLAHFKVYTVEHLAELTDESIQRIGPVRILVEKAQAYVALAAGNAPLEKLREDLKAKDNEMDVLKRQLAEAREAITRLEKASKK
ncbi:hypothetical protein D7X74_30415 [Corallococcus sp. CA047B]|uniref:hypothetical protein n=1 Tax=Corallococcus sp. CA047B TaxID=2316729 RepID=UPI000EA22AE7|nr:hypothetical protein [Corallococcus sp. CA047B]RKH08999.1 hypothetical protein D7X74_30415 [Corallococcus sp. CA047B]